MMNHKSGKEFNTYRRATRSCGQRRIDFAAVLSVGLALSICLDLSLFALPGRAEAVQSAKKSQPVNAHKQGQPNQLGQSLVRPNSALTPDEEVNVRVYKLANRSVVHIASLTDQDVLYNVEPKSGTASGTIISSDGYVLTNYHVIEQANQIRVTLFDGTMLRAELVGQDPSNDLAVIKIDRPRGKTLQALPFGDSSRLEVGRRVFAIGNPFGLDRSMTTGIVSSLARTYRTENNRLVKGVIQTDAAINPGNSGGPLLDTSGQMIGITSAILSRAGQSAGIGLAIPINIAKRIIPELIAHHGILRPDIGLQGVETDKGLQVERVEPNGPAAKAGLSGPKVIGVQQGPFLTYWVDGSTADIISAIDNMPVRSEDDLLSYVEQKKPGQVVTLTVLRHGKLVKVQVKLTTAGPA